MNKATILSAALAAIASGSLLAGASGVAQIQHSEGKHNKTYRDPIGVVTVCYGHTDKYLRMGMSFTDAECNLLLASDMALAQDGINSCTTAPLTGNQRDALTSFVLNVGRGNYCKSTMARHINAGNYRLAAKEFPKWKYAAGQALPGLAKRRAEEQALFLSTAPWKPYNVKSLLQSEKIRCLIT